ncbi:MULTISPECIES: FAD-dependent monooxygenase [unclassified Polaromonas]|uniref:FAD-dependent monooxygenase n=1 Tax=unclassified Polaromonas TaxID=2638319 RepID=UPI0018C9C261|nr:MULTISPECIES: FAD-dependent monooxygenase [unclassified Polaromonas]MBG6070316.1 3-(3-hydroxy-phenyl)propionate hydroxylase [Polaromonas sp. CG_9.7]MBG6112314.1 3-(3-hydroxy-phenyl)propionate hydroxylase [Polaromonas sp. CG_9.2]MDH6183960.1 3-(3-hydroxy-phenyl)propionate hydroxylase [Polaromonas sp. CG_23.6]
MHQPATQARPSIYYHYQVFKAWLPSAHAAQSRQQVVIAGAGPAGMVTALELARLGVASVVLTPELQVSQGSRAIVFTRRSMEILQQVGVAGRMSENGLPWRFGNSYYRGQRVFRMEAPHDADDRFFPMLNIQQQYLEEYLIDACQASPLIDLRWGNKVVGVAQAPGLARVSIDTPEGPYTLETDWLVAADGGRSDIRAALKLQMEGSSYEGLFVIADIRIDLPLPTERLAYFDPEWNPGNTILMHREPHGIWRVDYQLPPGETPEQALRPASLKRRIDAQLAMIGHAGTPWEMDWNSVYSARTLTLPDYVQGRVVFTGDAAHLLPIFGVRGANTAFQDAQSLGWHLAFVVRGLASDKLLASHSAERVGAAREIIDEAGKSTRFMAPPSRGFRLLRDAVLSLSLTEAFVRPLYHWRTSRPHAYSGSMLNSRGDDNALFSSGPAHGAPPQNIRLAPDDFLLDHLGGGFELLYFTQEAAIPEALRQVIAATRARGVPLRVTAVGATQPVDGADLTLADADGHFRQRYGVQASGAAFLLRPDQHVCARWLTLDATRLQAAFNIALPQ